MLNFARKSIGYIGSNNIRRLSQNKTGHNLMPFMSEITRYLEMKAGRNGVVIVGNQSSGKTSLVENTVSRILKHFEKTDRTTDSKRVRLELHKVRKYQSKMNLVEEEAKLIEHRDKLKSDRIIDAKKQMEERRNRRYKNMRL